MKYPIILFLILIVSSAQSQEEKTNNKYILTGNVASSSASSFTSFSNNLKFGRIIKKHISVFIVGKLNYSKLYEISSKDYFIGTGFMLNMFNDSKIKIHLATYPMAGFGNYNRVSAIKEKIYYYSINGDIQATIDMGHNFGINLYALFSYQEGNEQILTPPFGEKIKGAITKAIIYETGLGFTKYF